MIRVSYEYAHAPKGGQQTLVYSVWVSSFIVNFVWITVALDWLRLDASLNDLKQLAIAQAQQKRDGEMTVNC